MLSTNITMPTLLVIHHRTNSFDDSVEKILKKKNCFIETRDNLEIGLEIVKNTKFDAIVFELCSSFEDNTQFLHFIRNCTVTSPPLLFITDPEQKEKIERITGWINRPLYDFLTRPISDNDLNRILQNIINYKSFIQENRILKDRLIIFERQLGSMFSKLESKVQGNIEKLNKKNKFWHNFIDLMNLGILIVDMNYIIIQANAFFSKLINIPVEKIIGRSYLEVLNFKADFSKCPGYLALKTGKIETLERQTTGINEQFGCIRQTAIPTFNHVNDITGFIEYYQDVSAEKSEQDKWIYIEKIKTLEKLAGFFSNDNLFISSPEILESNIKKAVGYINNEIIMDYNSVESSSLVNINSLIIKIIQRYHITASKKKIKISYNFETEFLLININELQLARALAHLMDNAMDSMTNGGELKICTRRKVHNAIDIILSNNGDRICAINSEKIFEPFYTTKQRRLGLGLNICKSILEKYGGNLTLQLNENSDYPTAFIITLPCK